MSWGTPAAAMASSARACLGCAAWAAGKLLAVVWLPVLSGRERIFCVGGRIAGPSMNCEHLSTGRGLRVYRTPQRPVPKDNDQVESVLLSQYSLNGESLVQSL